jgi:hypothetical protein
MQAKLKGAIWASFAGFAFAGVALVATQMATLAGTLMARGFCCRRRRQAPAPAHGPQDRSAYRLLARGEA